MNEVKKRGVCLGGMAVLCFLLTLCSAGGTAEAAELPRREEEPQPAVEEFLLEDEWADFFEEQPVTLSELQKMEPAQILHTLWRQVTDRLQAPAKNALRVMAVLLLFGIFQLICRGSAQPELEYVLHSVMTVAIFLLLSEPVLQLLGDFGESVERCRVFLAQFVPILSGILTAGGQAGTATVYLTVFLGVITAVSQALSALVAPLIRIFLALSVTRGLCGSLQLDGIIGLLRRGVHWVMGLTTTVFGAYLGFQSVLANAADSLAMKTGKFVLAGGVPIVGGMVSEAIGTVYTGLKLVKSAAGILGILSLLVLFLPLLLQCMIHGFLCRVCAAAAQLFDNAPARGMLDGIAESLGMLQAVVILYLLLTILATALMVLLNTGGA